MTTIRGTGGLEKLLRRLAPKSETPKPDVKPPSGGSADGASVRSNWGNYVAPAGPLAGGRPKGGTETGGVRPEDEPDAAQMFAGGRGGGGGTGGHHIGDDGLDGSRGGGGGAGPDPGNPVGPPRDGAAPAQRFAGGRGGGGGTGGYTADPPDNDIA